jgi:putative component of membrane protein insertase Oxa1/YidC/SpoIIIJ protein YidD
MKKTIAFIWLLMAALSVHSQSASDVNLVIQGTSCRACSHSHTDHHGDISQKNSAFKTLLKLPIIVYQKFISSQMKPVCKFHPSCSEFSIEAINRFGIMGIFLGADRFMRCNNFSEYQYPLYENTDLLHDPVDQYIFSGNVEQQ